jgi:hypothetical protein
MVQEVWKYGLLHETHMINNINKVFEKFIGPRMVNYILAKRYCIKCAKRKLTPFRNISETLGICSSCKTVGIVFYQDD